jgi:hypothetical protein
MVKKSQKIPANAGIFSSDPKKPAFAGILSD